MLFVDNHDSFTFNLVHGFTGIGARVDVVRNDVAAGDVLSLAAARRSALLVLSPGPGAPEDAGCTVELAHRAPGRLAVFGVCLGHQAIVAAHGGTVGRTSRVVHGRTSRIRHSGHALFDSIPAEHEVGRYHSLAADRVPPELEVVARDGDLVMAVAHRTLPVWGVQFHPESILTLHGQVLLANVLRLAVNSADG